MLRWNVLSVMSGFHKLSNNYGIYVLQNFREHIHVGGSAEFNSDKLHRKYVYLFMSLGK